MGGHALSVADSIIKSGEFRILGYTDLSKNNYIDEYEYLGNDSILESLLKKGIKNAVISVGHVKSSDIRRKLYGMLKEIGYELPAIIDSSAVISANAIIGEGSFVGKNAVVNSKSTIGKMCIINSSSICEHETFIDDFSHVSIGAVCCGNVKIGCNCFIGANFTIIQNVSVGDNCIVGAASLVLKNIDNNTRVRRQQNV